MEHGETVFLGVSDSVVFLGGLLQVCCQYFVRGETYLPCCGRVIPGF